MRKAEQNGGKMNKSVSRKSLIGFAISGAVIVAVGFVAAQSGVADSYENKLTPLAARNVLAGQTATVMVKLKEQADLSRAVVRDGTPRADRIRAVYDVLRAKALETQGPLVELLTSKGFKFRRFYISNMITVYEATPVLVQELAARADVGKIYGNPVVAMQTPFVDYSKSRTTIGDNIIFSGADKVWDEFKTKGEGIVVAGQDTGVAWEHFALKKQYRGFDGQKADHSYNWHDSISIPISKEKTNKCGYNTAVPCDDDEHGTHTMGTMVGDDGGENVVGMAPGSKWMACRNMDSGNGTPSSYIECFEYFLAPFPHGADPLTAGDPSKAPHVINNSWGCPPSEGCTGDEILPSLQAMKQAGIMVVVSAGNEGSGCSTIQNPPAYHTGVVLSVGAYNHRTGVIASFSSRGPSSFDGGIGPNIVAPGVNIRSTLPSGGYNGGGWSGTSMAGPHVAGAVALIWAARPELEGRIAETISLLTSTATPKTADNQSCGGVPGTQVPNNTYGHGIMNVYAALKK